MQDEYYHQQDPCQEAFSRKDELISSAYYKIPISYEEIRLKGYLISPNAYDLYLTLRFLFEESLHEKFAITAQNLCWKTGLTKTIYKEAKNELLTCRLLKLDERRGYDTACVFEPYVLAGTRGYIPQDIFSWLTKCLIAKRISRRGKLAYVHLYQLFVMQQYPKLIESYRSDMAHRLNLSSRQITALIHRLVAQNFIQASSVKNQEQRTYFKLLIPNKISLLRRVGAPLPLAKLTEHNRRMTELMAKICPLSVVKV